MLKHHCFVATDPFAQPGDRYIGVKLVFASSKPAPTFFAHAKPTGRPDSILVLLSRSVAAASVIVALVHF